MRASASARFGILYLDLDGFKIITINFGHEWEITIQRVEAYWKDSIPSGAWFLWVAWVAMSLWCAGKYWFDGKDARKHWQKYNAKAVIRTGENGMMITARYRYG